MARSFPTVGIAGGGIGGLAAAIALRRLGIEATVFEQAAQFTRIGADVNLTPNSVRALDGLGIGDAPCRRAAPLSRQPHLGQRRGDVPDGNVRRRRSALRRAAADPASGGRVAGA